MTQDQAVQQVISIAKKYNGYSEGRNNSNRFSTFMGYPAEYWCDDYVDSIFKEAFGYAVANKVMCGGCGEPYTPSSAAYYKNVGRWTTVSPQPGDQIFFKNSVRINHTGIVISVSGSTVRTIEGNTSPQGGVDPNGGGVYIKEYYRSNSRIAGYGHPNWSVVASEGITPITPSRDWLQKGDKGSEVKVLQQNLIKLGFSCGSAGADGDFGNGTLSAVKTFQKKYKLTADGQAGKITMAKIAELLKPAPTPLKVANRLIADGQIHANNYVGAGLVVDGIRGAASKKATVEVIQHALNQQYNAKLVEDGIWGAKTSAAISNVVIKKGSNGYMVTALEICLLLVGIDPKGVENPGIFGDGLDSATRKYQKSKKLEVDGEAGKQTFTSLPK